MTETMAERARSGARALGLDHVEVRLGEATASPVESSSVDVVISNGMLTWSQSRHERLPRSPGFSNPQAGSRLATSLLARC